MESSFRLQPFYLKSPNLLSKTAVEMFTDKNIFNLMLIGGTLRSFGIIYAELLQTYNVSAGYTAKILSIVIFLVAVGGMFH